MISTLASPKSNWSRVKSQSSSVQVLVNASGKKASRTLRLPRNDDSVTLSPDVDRAVKSGAGSPGCGTFCICELVIRKT